MNRRQVLAGALPLALGAAGCLDAPGSATGTTDEPNRAPATTTATATTRTPDTSTPVGDATTRTGTPDPNADATTPPNDTPYPAVVQWAVPEGTLGGRDPELALLTDDGWRRRVEADALAPAVRQFLDDTAFGREVVVALSASLPVPTYSLLAPRSLDGVGDAIPHLVAERSSDDVDPATLDGPAVGDPPRQLLAVRIPTEGRRPEAALATFHPRADRVEMAADPTPPPVNGTPYEVAWSEQGWEWLDANEESPAELVTAEGWRDRLAVEALPENVRTLLSGTDFGAASVVLFGVLLPVCDNRPVLRRVSDLGTARPELHVAGYDPYCPQNGISGHLLAVRLPDRGTTPEGAVVRFESRDEPTRFRAGD